MKKAELEIEVKKQRELINKMTRNHTALLNRYYAVYDRLLMLGYDKDGNPIPKQADQRKFMGRLD